MSVSGAIGEIVAERWIERTMEQYPAEILTTLRGERDRFRNPAGYVLQESLTALASQLMGEMDERAVRSALDGLIRLRAVQDFSPSAALRFIFDLRGVLTEVLGPVPEQLERRIDELALMAFDHYMACREQVVGLREKERHLREQCTAK